MKKELFLKPAKGLQVRDPKTYKPLPESGAWVTPSGYWFRRLKDGDVEKTTPPKASRKAATKTSAEE